MRFGMGRRKLARPVAWSSAEGRAQLRMRERARVTLVAQKAEGSARDRSPPT